MFAVDFMTSISSEVAAISVAHLNKQYEEPKNSKGFALRDVSFTLPAGTILGLIGENGAGKTTLIKLLLNAISRDSGSIRFWGKDLDYHEKEIKSQIGVVLDEGFFYEGMTPRQVGKVLSNVFVNWDEPLFYGYLERFSLPTDQPVKEFSKGMKMKLSLVSALAHHPKLLLLDEPTGGIDPVCRNEILDLFLEFVQSEENSILFSSHITSDMEKVADYLLYLHEGRQVLCGEREDILFGYAVLKCSKDDFAQMTDSDIVAYRENQFGVEVLVRERKTMAAKYPNAVVENISIEQLMVFLQKKEQNHREKGEV